MGEDKRNTRGCVIRAKPSFSDGEKIQILKYYKVCDTGWIIMDELNVAGSQ